MNQYTEADVRAMWCCTRKNNCTISDEALDAMRDTLVDTLSKPADSGRVGDDVRADLASYQRMFAAACDALGRVSHDLGIDPDEGGAEPILAAIAELRKSRDEWVDAQYHAAALAAQGQVAVAAGQQELLEDLERVIQAHAGMKAGDEGAPAMTIRVCRQAIKALAAQGQGEADLAGYVDTEQVADMQRNGGGVLIGSFSERYGRTHPVYYLRAPSQQAERGDGAVSDEVVEIACKAASEVSADGIEAVAWPDEYDADELSTGRLFMRTALEAVAPLLRAPAQGGRVDRFDLWFGRNYPATNDGANSGSSEESAIRDCARQAWQTAIALYAQGEAIGHIRGVSMGHGGKYSAIEFTGESLPYGTPVYTHAERARVPGLLSALNAAHYYIDASDCELAEDGITREQALRKARDLKESAAPSQPEDAGHE